MKYLLSVMILVFWSACGFASDAVVKSRPFIVAIDPGHGGQDPGAIGSRGTREKDIALTIAKKLQHLVNQQAGMKGVLIRDGDYYVHLRERTRLARKHGADLFISIHADSYKNSSAHGASVFVLSKRGASSEAARWLAAHENQADLIGGVSLNDKDSVLASVLLDLSQTASNSASIDLGEAVLRELDKIVPLHKRKVESAGFMVLKSPDIPSILVETGFISNRKGEENLKRDEYQWKLARAIMQGVLHYTDRRPPPVLVESVSNVAVVEVEEKAPHTLASPSVTKEEGVAVASQIHVVSRGETLFSVARKYKVPVQMLRSYNHMSDNTLKTGQTLKIPSSHS